MFFNIKIHSLLIQQVTIEVRVHLIPTQHGLISKMDYIICIRLQYIVKMQPKFS